MPAYLVTDPQSGRKVKLTGDSPPTEQELEQIFASVGQPQGQAQPQQQPGMMGRINETLMRIPGVPQAAEFASGANRAIVGALDIIPQGVNEIARRAGVDARLPTVRGTVGNEVGAPRGEFVGPGLQADILGAAGETAALGLGTGALLRGAANAIPAASQSVGANVMRTMASTTAGQDIAAGALSGAGSEVGREVGGETGAMVGAIAAPAIPSLARATGAEAIRRIFRGGEAGRQAVASAVDDAARAGTSLTVGGATGNRTIQAGENISSRVAGGGPLIRASERSSNDIRDRLTQMADNISGTRGAEASGRVITTAIQGRGGFVDRFQGQSGALWNAVDDAIGRDTQVTLQNTKTALDDLVRTDALGSVLNNAKITQIRNALNSTEGLDYGTLRELRSQIGAKISNTDLISDIPRAELRRLYGAITEDIKAAAGASGNNALRAFTRANNYTRSGHARIDGFIGNVMRKADFAKVYEAVTKGGEGSQTVNAFKRSMQPEEWEVVASNVVRELGRAADGNQGAAGEAFSVAKFLTDWNKLGPARNALFSGSRTLDHYGRDLAAIARTAERIKMGAQAGANPSGSGQFMVNMAAATTAGGAVVTGNAPMFSTVMGALATNNLAARLMSSPRFVNWLAGTTRVNGQQMGAQLAKLAAIQQASGMDEAVAISGLIQDLEDQTGGQQNGQVAARPSQ